MKIPTLASEFTRIRKEKDLLLWEIGEACDLNETTVHKVGSGRPVRWETLHLILAIGMKIPPGTTEYESMHRLWLKQREEIALKNTPAKGTKTSPKHEVAAVQTFRRLIAGMDEKSVKAVLTAAKRRARI